jgi:hypothetical protein
MNSPPVRRPQQTSQIALACLDALALSGAGRLVSLGGAFGMSHYLEYRSTKDIDAWWMEGVTAAERERVVAVLDASLRVFGDVQVRSWGDVTSVDVSRSGAVIFSFQIAIRSARLDESVESSWPGVRLDALSDLVASKMVALVERGAPRDLLDVYTVCERQVASVRECWALWERRQELARQSRDRHRARLAL